MGLRVPEVDQQPIPHIAGEVALKAADLLGAGLLIGQDHLAQVFRIKLLSQRGRAHQITEHHGELAPLRFRGSHHLRPCRFGVSLRTRRVAWSLRAFPFTALGWGRLPFCFEGRSTVSTELSGGAHLLATTWADPQELSAALLTELQARRIVKPTARAMHAASLLLWALRGKENGCALTVRQQSAAACSGLTAPHRHTAHQHTRRAVTLLL